jgi:predicted DsbA family dithiol-disulfide isomerase
MKDEKKDDEDEKPDEKPAEKPADATRNTHLLKRNKKQHQLVNKMRQKRMKQKNKITTL